MSFLPQSGLLPQNGLLPGMDVGPAPPTLVAQSVARTGLNPSYEAAHDSKNTAEPRPRAFLHAKNGSGGTVTVTIAVYGEVAPDLPVLDVAVSIPAGAERMIGPFPRPWFVDPTHGQVEITYSSAASVTVGVFDLSQP
jgi:hypothetical protein